MSRRNIPLGAIVGTHGIAGWVKLKPFNPNSTVLLSTREVCLAQGERSCSYVLDHAKRHKKILLLKLQNVDTRDDAERLVGSELSVSEDALEPLGHGEYYYLDVVGFDVFDTQSHYLGKIARVWLKDGGDLYVVDGPNKEHLIPATKELIDKVDLPNRCMIVDLPEGFLDL